MENPGISNFSTQLELKNAPIHPDWILEGAPAARNRVLSPSTDRFAWTMLWDCTAGSFNWFYSVDETVHVIEGSVTVTDGCGVSKTLMPGDIAFFPAGSKAHWHIDKYVRKVAFCHKPLPAAVHIPMRALRMVATQIRNQARTVVNLIRSSLALPGIEADATADEKLKSLARLNEGTAKLTGPRRL